MYFDYVIALTKDRLYSVIAFVERNEAYLRAVVINDSFWTINNPNSGVMPSLLDFPMFLNRESSSNVSSSYKD